MKTARGLLALAALLLISYGFAVRYRAWAGGLLHPPDAQSRYEPLARSLMAGRGFTLDERPPYRPDSFDQPGYPALLAVVRAFSEAPRAVLAVQLILELATLVTIWTWARVLGRTAAGWLAVLLGWSCPFLPMFAQQVLTESLATLLLAGTGLALARAALSPRPLPAAVSGGALAGLALLVRGDALPGVVLMLAAGAAVRAAGRPFDLRARLAAGLTLILVLFPWAIRCHRELGSAWPLGRAAVQAGSAYARWLGTWVDDPVLQPFWWRALDPAAPGRFPEENLPDAQARARADAALDEARRAGHFTPASEEAFRELSRQAVRERPLRALVLVPLKRTTLAWLRLPGYISDRGEKALVYGYWIALLAAGGLGLLRALRHRSAAMTAAALVLGRSLLPLTSGIAVEPRYVVEALPALFVLAALTAGPHLAPLWTDPPPLNAPLAP